MLEYIECFNKDSILEARVRLGRIWYNLQDYLTRVEAESKDEADYQDRLSPVVMLTIRGLLSGKLARREGSIVNIASVVSCVMVAPLRGPWP